MDTDDCSMGCGYPVYRKIPLSSVVKRGFLCHSRYRDHQEHLVFSLVVAFKHNREQLTFLSM